MKFKMTSDGQTSVDIPTEYQLANDKQFMIEPIISSKGFKHWIIISQYNKDQHIKHCSG